MLTILLLVGVKMLCLKHVEWGFRWRSRMHSRGVGRVFAGTVQGGVSNGGVISKWWCY